MLVAHFDIYNDVGSTISYRYRSIYIDDVGSTLLYLYNIVGSIIFYRSISKYIDDVGSTL